MKAGKVLKRITVCAVTAGLAVSMLAGCGPNGESGEGSDVMTVNVWSPDSHSQAAMTPKIQEFNDTIGKEQGIKIEYSVKTDLDKMLEMAFEAENAPEIFSKWIDDATVEKGWVLPIKEITGGPELIEKYEPVISEGNYVKGDIYNIPIYATIFGIAYNKDIFKKYGIVDENGEAKPPQTYEEVLDAARKITHPDEQEFGFIMPLKDTNFRTHLKRAAYKETEHNDFNNATGKYDFSGYLPMYQLFTQMKSEGLCYPGAEGVDNDQARALFAEGKLGMIFTASFDVAVWRDQFPSKCDWDVVDYPTTTMDKRDNVNMSPSKTLFSINKLTYDKLDDAGKEKIATVFNWFHSDELVRYMYQTGCEIPNIPSIVDGVELDDNVSEVFAHFKDLGATYVPGWKAADAESVMTGEKKSQDVFLDTVWTQGKPEEAVEDLNTRYNAALERWLSEHPEKKIEDYIHDKY